MLAHLIPVIEKLAGHSVMVLGDLMLDRFVYGQVERISPEAPIPVLHATRETLSLGGAGNVVRNIASLDGLVTFVSVVGNDKVADEIGAELKATPNVTAYMLTDPSRPTTLKVRYIANGQQLLRADHEKAEALSTALEDKVIRMVEENIKACKALILSDYSKGVLTPRVTKAAIAAAKAVGAKILIDPKGRDYGRYDGATMLTPNRKELAEIAGHPITDVKGAEAIARTLIDTHKLSGVLAKLGGDGVCLVMKNAPAVHYHTVAREVYDVSGAGDTVISTMALALASGAEPTEAAMLANIAGSIVVGKVGTASVSRDDLLREVLASPTLGQDAKTGNSSFAADMAERWRKQGLKVGFTNGCFDLLHPGHISLIRQARAACDKLVLGLNSDASVKRLKGESRPVHNEQSRTTVLAALSDVDLVVVFDEDTPMNLIKAIRPDVLIKGADYTVDKVVGADLVQSWGGKIVLAELVAGQSTTSTIARMNEKSKAG